MTPQVNIGEFFMELNKTIFSYRWSGLTKLTAGVPSLNVVILDYGSTQITSNGQDQDKYNNFKNELRYRNRNVRYLVVSNNQSTYKDILRDDTDLVPLTTSIADLATRFENKICENPAQLIYNDCADKPSESFAHTSYITPGYKQNWAMYPEYFLKTGYAQFKVLPILILPNKLTDLLNSG